jgi:hypothetical protein
MEFDKDPEKSVAAALKVLKEKGLIEKEDWVVTISHLISNGQPIDSVQMRRVE